MCSTLPPWSALACARCACEPLLLLCAILFGSRNSVLAKLGPKWASRLGAALDRAPRLGEGPALDSKQPNQAGAPRGAFENSACRGAKISVSPTRGARKRTAPRREHQNQHRDYRFWCSRLRAVRFEHLAYAKRLFWVSAGRNLRMLHTPRFSVLPFWSRKGAPRLDGVLDRARRLGEKPCLGPKWLQPLSECRTNVANSSEFVSQAHRVQARTLQGGKVL